VLLALPRPNGCRVILVCISRRVWILEDLGIAVQRDYKMCNPQRFHNLDDDSATDYVSWGVLAMGVVRLDVEVGEVARLGGQGRLQS